MTLEDLLPNAPNGSPKAWQRSIEYTALRPTVHDEIMTDDVEPQLPLSPVEIIETGSDYGDFASDEEEIINNILGNIEPPSPFLDAPLLVTDIEDYEEPRGVRLPKILGVERSTPFWLPQVQVQEQDQIVRGGDSSHSIYNRLVHVALTLTH
jgi:hypothetical protein